MVPASAYTAPSPSRPNIFAMSSSSSTEDEQPEFSPTSRNLTRTPSPTPSEQAELAQSGLLDWKKYTSWSYWSQGRRIWYLLLLSILIVLVILSLIFHNTITDWMQPFANWMHSQPVGPLIPVAIFFVISFPPLFGHEILAILCGVVWSLGVGFGIVAVGTLLGEWGNYYAFKHCCRTRAEKMEASRITYAALANVIRDGGFKVVLICRFSVIPGHLTTVLFSTCGIGIVSFTLAAILSLPKQFVAVYTGVLLEQSKQGTLSATSKAVTVVMIVITAIVTVVAMWFMRKRIGVAKEEIIYSRRKARQRGNLACLPKSDQPSDSQGGVDSSSPLNDDMEGHVARTLVAPEASRQSSRDQHISVSVYTSRPADSRF